MPSPTIPDPGLPWEDDEEAPGLWIRPLSPADLRAFLAEWDDDEQPLRLPPVAQPPHATRPATVPSLPTVSQAGRSAQAQYRRRRGAELAAWTRTLPLRLAATLTAGVVLGLVAGRLLDPPLGVLTALAAAGTVGWRLRFRPSTETRAWRRGAIGEQRTARLLDRLERHGWRVLHDLAVPGSRANLDHLVIGPGGLFVVDSKHYRGRLRLTADATLWHGRYPLTLVLRAVRFEADRAAQVLAVPGITVAPIVAVHGAPVPWGTLVVGGVTVVAARHLTDLLRARPTTLSPQRVAWLANRATAVARSGTWSLTRMAETWLRTVFSDSTSLPWTRPDYMGAELGFFNPPGWHDMGWPADRPQPAAGMPRCSQPALDGLPGGDAEPFKTARRIGARRWRRGWPRRCGRPTGRPVPLP